MANEDSKAGKDIRDVAKSVMDAQLEIMRKAANNQAEAFTGFLSSLQAFAGSGAVFKTSLQKSGRISVPEAEREALGLKEGDLVQVVVIPLRKS